MNSILIKLVFHILKYKNRFPHWKYEQMLDIVQHQKQALSIQHKDIAVKPDRL